MRRRIVITGAHGFVGRHVARWFADRGDSVAGMGHGVWSQEEWSIWGFDSWHSCDINLETLLTYAGEPDAIIHCAGGGSVSFSVQHPVQDFHRTVLTTLEVLEFVRLHTPRTRVVYPSSAAVYGQVALVPIAEVRPLNPVSPYGMHKRIAEELLQSYGRNFHVAAVTIRLFSVYGDGLRKQLLWDTCSKIANNEVNFFGTGEEVRDWLHVSDAAALLGLALDHAAPSCPIVNGATGVGVSIKQLLETAFVHAGRSDRPVFSGTVRTGDPDRYVADASLAHSWGWRPVVDWRRGLLAYMDWYKKTIINTRARD